MIICPAKKHICQPSSGNLILLMEPSTSSFFFDHIFHPSSLFAVELLCHHYNHTSTRTTPAGSFPPMAQLQLIGAKSSRGPALVSQDPS
jgi:hypothetical protein